MSDARASASEINARAAAWIQRRDISDWGVQEQVAFDTWLAESLAHRAAYLRLEAVWQRTERSGCVACIDRERRGCARTRWSVSVAHEIDGRVCDCRGVEHFRIHCFSNRTRKPIKQPSAGMKR